MITNTEFKTMNNTLKYYLTLKEKRIYIYISYSTSG